MQRNGKLESAEPPALLFLPVVGGSQKKKIWALDFPQRASRCFPDLLSQCSGAWVSYQGGLSAYREGVCKPATSRSAARGGNRRGRPLVVVDLPWLPLPVLEGSQPPSPLPEQTLRPKASSLSIVLACLLSILPPIIAISWLTALPQLLPLPSLQEILNSKSMVQALTLWYHPMCRHLILTLSPSILYSLHISGKCLLQKC